MIVYRFIYRCRQCGALFDGATAPEDVALMTLNPIMQGKPSPSALITQTWRHCCEENVWGIGDMIGWRESEE